MSDEITPEVFEHMVRLAALELQIDEGEVIRRQLNNQLKAIKELEAIPVDSTLPMTSHGVPYNSDIRPAIRADEWQPCPNPEEILKQAPELQDGYILVPDIPHQELD